MPGLSINLGQRLWDMAEEMFERALRGDPPLLTETETEPEPPPAPFTGEVIVAGVQYPADDPDDRRVVKVFRLREDGCSEDALAADGEGNPFFSQPEAARIAERLRERGELPEGVRFVPEPEGWREGLEHHRPFYDYLSDCDTTGEVFTCPNHYRRHVRAGEKVCDRARAEMEEWERYVQCVEECDPEHGCECEDFPWAEGERWNDLPLAERPHRVYLLRFPLGGGVEDWYYGITSKSLSTRVWGHNAEVGDRRNAGEVYSAATLCIVSDKKTALAVERELIRAGNPTGGRLINKTHKRGER